MDLRGCLACIPGLLLAGCAAFSPDGGVDGVNRIAAPHVGHAVPAQRGADATEAIRRRTAELLARELTADGAVELALLNQPALRAGLAELGVAEADLVQAGRLPNPSLRFGRLGSSGHVEIDRSVLVDVLGLVTWPVTQRVEQQRYAAAQLRTAAGVVDAAAAARRAYVDAVAARMQLGYAEQVHDAADAAAELARRMEQAGNFSTLARLREQAFVAQAGIALEHARARDVAARERLGRALGIDPAATGLRLPAALPPLPPSPIAAPAAEQTAIDQRIDVRLATQSAAALAESLGLTRATRLVNVLDAGYANKSQTGQPREDGYEIELMLPLFDFGETRVVRAEARYQAALAQAADAALRARAEVRIAYAGYRSAYAAAQRYRDDVVPLAQAVSAENLLRYNAMQIGVFDLLADAREQIASVSGAVDALRRYWRADADLQAALAGPLSRADRTDTDDGEMP
ncbi:MAG: TolC family protein [Proteobacteria bacterium]|nr:TolC family protein [Pseudomonadota bacterium]